MGEVRIIGGKWKRTKLAVPERPGLRPTPSRVRETLFNWLGQDLRGWSCIDAFAGTGALGFEAASRGAASVVLVERDAALAAQLERTRVRLGDSAVRVVQGDGVAFLAGVQAAAVDLVFLDPPFDTDLARPAIEAAARVVRPEGRIYLEAPIAFDPDLAAGLGLSVLRNLRAGSVHAMLLQPATA